MNDFFAVKSWIDVAPDSHFPIQNLPFGIFTKKGKQKPRVGVAIGDYVLDLKKLSRLGYLKSLNIENESVFGKKYLNDFIALGKEVTNAVRLRIFELLREDFGELKDREDHIREVLVPAEEAEMLMPVKVGNYTDFYSSEQHAYNVGCMFRDPQNALLPNWKHMPVAYHGRASSIVVSGTDIVRPSGQTKPEGAAAPVFGPTKRLDFELETAFVVGKTSHLGKPVPIEKAEEYIFGFVLFNDWSARDIQQWEYVPLGPFLGKNFASSVSPWVVTREALEPFRVPGPTQEPEVLPYLKTSQPGNFNVHLEVALAPAGGSETVISRSNFKYLYWSPAQQLAHHTCNGCNIKVGDLYASGTISGPTEDSYGSMLELAWKGTKPLKLSDGSEHSFIQNGDTVVLRGYAEKQGVRIGFGEVRNKIIPAI